MDQAEFDRQVAEWERKLSQLRADHDNDIVALAAERRELVAEIEDLKRRRDALRHET
jgi:cell division protein FtsB